MTQTVDHGHVTAYIVCKFQLDLRCAESGLNLGRDLAGLGDSYLLTCPGQTGSLTEKRIEGKATTSHGLPDDML